MIVSRKMALGAAIPFLLVLLPLSLGQSGSISDQAAYLEQLDKFLQSLPPNMTEITYNPDGSVAKTVTFDPAGCSKRVVIYNSDGTKSILVQACALVSNNALSYQLDQNGDLVSGTKTVTTSQCLPQPACVKPAPPAPKPDTGSDIIVVNAPTVTRYFRYCETTKQWEEVKNV